MWIRIDTFISCLFDFFDLVKKKISFGKEKDRENGCRFGSGLSIISYLGLIDRDLEFEVPRF